MQTRTQFKHILGVILEHITVENIVTLVYINNKTMIVHSYLLVIARKIKKDNYPIVEKY